MYTTWNLEHGPEVWPTCHIIYHTKQYTQVLQMDALLEPTYTELLLISFTKHNCHIVFPKWRPTSHKHLVTTTFLVKTGLGNQMKSVT